MDPDFLHHSEAFGVRLLALIVSPFVQFIFEGGIFWWPNLIATFVVAFFAFSLLHRGGWSEFRRRHLSRRIWAHKSAEADYAYYLVNSVFYTAIVAPLVVTGAAIGVRVERMLDFLLGPPGPPHLSLWLMRAIYTVLFFLAYDFARFLAHGLLHDVPLLWPFHKVHHSAEVLTPITSYRTHPVELFVMAAIPNLATGLVSGVVWYAAADRIGFYMFFGAHAFIALFNTIANLRHCQVWISFGPVLNRWFISPAHHQIHHSADPRHFGKNRGFELALWDRMCGTLYVPGAEEELRLGLGDGTDAAWHGVGRMYLWPFRYALALCGIGRAPALDALENPPASRHRI